MNSDLDRLREFGADLAPPTGHVPAALRRRVLDPPVRRRPPRRPLLSWRPAGVVTAVLLTVVGVAVLSTGAGRTVGPIHGPSAYAHTPAQVLRLAAARLAVTPAPRVRADQFVYVQSVAVYQDVYLDGTSSPAGIPMLVREWRSVDGTRDGLVERRPLNRPRGTWLDEVIPGCHGGVLGGGGHVACQPSPGSDGGLPTTGDAMYSYLYRTATDGLPPDYAAQITPDDRAFQRAASALDRARTSPVVQAAVFTALTMVPAVTVTTGVSDVSGRPGVALVHKGQYLVTQLIFDPDTYQYLGMTQELAEPTPFTNHRRVVIRLATQQAYQRVAVVDKIGELP